MKQCVHMCEPALLSVQKVLRVVLATRSPAFLKTEEAYREFTSVIDLLLFYLFSSVVLVKGRVCGWPRVTQ